MLSNRILLSLRTDKLQVAQQVDAGVELKLDRDDKGLVTGNRDLTEFLKENNVSQDQLVSVHPPPGNRGRQTDTTIAEDNVGNVIRFSDTQLQTITPEFVVLHTVRRFNVRDHLILLQQIATKLDVRLAVENPPGSSYWSTTEDHAFFAYTAATADTPWYLTIDTYHLGGDPTQGFVNEDHVESVLDRVTNDGLSDEAAEQFRTYVESRVAEASVPDISDASDDPWFPTLRTLVLAGDSVQSVHLNDPANDGVPDLVDTDSQALDAIFEFVKQHDIYVVLEPDDYDAQMLRDAVKNLQQRLG